MLGQVWKLWDQVRCHCHDTGKMTVAWSMVLAMGDEENWPDPGSIMKVELKTECADGLERDKSPRQLQNFRLSNWKHREDKEE